MLAEITEVFDLSTVQVIVATGGVPIKADMQVPNNVFIEKYINADAILPYCDLAVCHGGNGTIYQALAHGVPVLGIATHDEQYYCLQRVNDLKLGRGLKYSEVKKQGMPFLRHAVQKVLNDPSYKQGAKKMQKEISNWNGAQLAAEKILNWLS